MRAVEHTGHVKSMQTIKATDTVVPDTFPAEWAEGIAVAA